MFKYDAIKLYYLKGCVLIASKPKGEGKGFNPVGVDTLGPVVRGCLKAIFRNATQRAWCARVRYAPILTQFPRLLVSVTLQTNLCKPDDGQARPKHVADVTS